VAVANLTAFHKTPEPMVVETMPGVRCERRWRPLDRAGLYVPGGSAPLVSSVLMVGVPARIAGVPERILCTPPSRDGGVDPSILAAAHIAGVQRVFAIGGAQAIAAMAYGTATVPKADKIFGPGNPWVTEAKHQCAMDPMGADQDLPAGPSEALIIADAGATAAFVAADLLSQAEHGADSPVALVATAPSIVGEVHAQLLEQIQTLSRREIIEASLSRLVSIVAADLDEAFAISNAYAPEHLVLHIDDAEAHASRVCAAGTVLVGRLSPVAAGDYASGSNHVLPTDGWARRRSGLSVESFMRAISFQRLNPEGVAQLAETVETLAALEGLDAHARSMALRREATE
jgi:histidinol dehydrogenase